MKIKRSHHILLLMARCCRCVRIVLLAGFFALLSFTGAAAEIGTQWHGFASQGYLKTSSNRFFGDSEEGSVDFHEIGVNTSVRATPKLRFAAQVISRAAGKTDEGSPMLDYMFADFLLGSQAGGDWGLYVGRVKNPYGFYNNTRDVVFTRPGLLLPQSIYFDRVRDFALSADGMQLYGEYRFDDGFVEVQGGLAKPRVGSRSEIELFHQDTQAQLDANPSWGGRVMYTSMRHNYRVAYSYVDLKVDYDTGASSVDTIHFTPRVLSFELNSARWNLVTEYALREFSVPPNTMPKESFTGESYYVQLQYFLNSRWQALARADYMFVDISDRNGKKLEAITSGAMAAHSQFATDYAVGMSWRHKNWLVLLEQHWINGTAWLPVADNPQPQGLNQRWQMFGLAVSVRF